MKIGTMEADLSSGNLDFLKAIGVNNIVATDHRLFGFDRLGYWDAGQVEDARKHCEAHGIKLDMLALPMQSKSVEVEELPNIVMGTPERDAEI